MYDVGPDVIFSMFGHNTDLKDNVDKYNDTDMGKVRS